MTSPKNLLAFWALIPGGNVRIGMGGIWVAFALSTLDNCRALLLPCPKGELPKNMKTSFLPQFPLPSRIPLIFERRRPLVFFRGVAGKSVAEEFQIFPPPSHFHFPTADPPFPFPFLFFV